MRKFIATILAILYLLTSTGATIHVHYCMGKLKSIGFWHSNSKKDACPTCVMANKKGCCEDNHQIVKIDEQYDVPRSTIAFYKYFLQIPYYNSINFHLEIVPSSGITYRSTNSPPGINTISLYIVNCVYRI